MTTEAVSQPVALKAGNRLATIDILRGLIIVIMVLDHVRDYVHISGFGLDPIDFRVSNPILYATRWITHLCAPTFIFLAGVSAWLQHVKGKDTKKLSGFLLTRGLWLIVLELTVVGVAWNFSPPFPPFLAILWAIGWSMIALAALVYLPRPAVLAIGIAIIAGHNLLDGIKPEQLGGFDWFWNFLMVPKVFMSGGQPVALLFYPVLPWIGVIAFGYGMGEVFLRPDRNRILLLAGAAMLVAFAVLRGFNIYGDPRPWAPQADFARSAMDFMNVLKYPPSLLYVCATLGVIFLVIQVIDKLPAAVSGVLRTIGSVPMIAYLSHIYIMHAVAIIAHLIAGKSLTGQFDTLRITFMEPQIMNGTDLPLWVVYLCWVIVVALVYPLCLYWSKLKRERKDWWLSYL